MARKKEEDEVKTGGWINTFADLMNLLLCFFVLLFSMSEVDAQKFQEVAASLSQSLSIFNGGQTGIGEGILIASGASQLTQLSEFYSDLGLNTEGESETISAKDQLAMEQLQQSEDMAADINEALKDNNISDSIEVQATTHYVMLTMKGALLFDMGKADLTPEAIELLDVVGDILKQYDGNMIEILGHTDNIPINGELFTSNDVLSTYRALAVFDYLVDNEGIDPKYVKHSGRGEYDPIADNSTEEGRALNRRVEIKIYNTLSE